MGNKRQRRVQRVGFQAYSRQNASVYSERRRRQHTKHRLSKTLIALAVAVVVVGIAWVVSVQARLNNSSTITDSLRQALYDVTETDPYYVLLLGTDGRPGESDYRSDTIVLMRVDPVDKKITMISIPRDTKVTYNGTVMKINATHTYAGAEGVVTAVNELCGVKISHYVEVSFDGFSTVVDALGGVTVDVDEKIDDSKAGDEVIEAGTQTLDGAQALTYCRSRNFADGDYTRTRHQRTFLTALINQVLATSDPAKMISVVNSVADMVSTDLSVTQIASMINQMRGMDSANIYSCTIPSTTATISGQSYVVADSTQLAKLMERVNSGEDPQGPDTMNEGLDGTTL